ncbi:MAG: transporter substrate-binding domain-containing protein [Clostridia bacterium]|nr:transporter substrate-binding domain-containing protein [Clostridia bacterium]
MKRKHYFKKYSNNSFMRRLNIYWKNANKTALLIAFSVLVLLIIVFSAVTSQHNTSKNYMLIKDKSEIIIGIGSENPSFGSVDENGTVTGFEKDLAELVFKKMYPDKHLRIMHVESHEISYLLKNGTIDVAFSMLVPGNIKTQGLSLSSAYYSDPIAIYTTERRSEAGVASLGSSKIYYMEMRRQQAVRLFDSLDVKNVRLTYSNSYPDVIVSITQSSSYAVLVPLHKGMNYFHSLFRLEYEPIANVNYCAAFWKENADVIPSFNSTVSSLKDDISALKEKWNI